MTIVVRIVVALLLVMLFASFTWFLFAAAQLFAEQNRERERMRVYAKERAERVNRKYAAVLARSEQLGQEDEERRQQIEAEIRQFLTEKDH